MLCELLQAQALDRNGSVDRGFIASTMHVMMIG